MICIYRFAQSDIGKKFDMSHANQYMFFFCDIAQSNGLKQPTTMSPCVCVLCNRLNQPTNHVLASYRILVKVLSHRATG